MARNTAYQFIDAANVVENVRNCGQSEIPANESQARPLAQLPPEEQPEARIAARAFPTSRKPFKFLRIVSSCLLRV